jgi:hypothetical protein
VSTGSNAESLFNDAVGVTFRQHSGTRAEANYLYAGHLTSDAANIATRKWRFAGRNFRQVSRRPPLATGTVPWTSEVRQLHKHFLIHLYQGIEENAR